MAKATDIFTEIPELNYSETPDDADVKEFIKVIEGRRSVRAYTDEKIPEEVVRSCLDLACVGGHRNVSDGRVFGFARTVRNHRRVARLVGHFHGLQGFAQGADLVDFDQD